MQISKRIGVKSRFCLLDRTRVETVQSAQTTASGEEMEVGTESDQEA